MFEDVYGITDLKSSEEHEPLDQDFQDSAAAVGLKMFRNIWSRRRSTVLRLLPRNYQAGMVSTRF